MDIFKEKIGKLGFGMMRLPKQNGIIDLDTAKKMVDEFISRGFNYFDTAYIYPGSEAALGEILARNNIRDKQNGGKIK